MLKWVGTVWAGGRAVMTLVRVTGLRMLLAGVIGDVPGVGELLVRIVGVMSRELVRRVVALLRRVMCTTVLGQVVTWGCALFRGILFVTRVCKR